MLKFDSYAQDPASTNKSIKHIVASFWGSTETIDPIKVATRKLAGVCCCCGTNNTASISYGNVEIVHTICRTCEEFVRTHNAFYPNMYFCTTLEDVIDAYKQEEFIHSIEQSLYENVLDRTRVENR